MHGYRPGHGAARARVLYLFRSPPNLQIGRKSLDAEVREALEHTHPDLTFDWVGLLREPMPPARPDPRERGPRQRAQARKERDRSPRDTGSAKPRSAPEVVFDDESLLGRTLGGAEAARLRGRYAELNNRIVRRARTPEDRDRLLEAAVGLNPDSWTDEAAIRGSIVGIDARFEAVAGELPRRRRGRRGGRSREEGDPDQPAPGSVIIGRNESHEDHAEAAQDDALADRATTVDSGDAERPAAPTADGGSGDPETDVR
jgi:hypothetical protein